MKRIEEIDWNMWAITILFILLITTFFATKSAVRTQTINEIYDEIDRQYLDCVNSCGNLLHPAWINIRQRNAECVCLNILDDGNQTDNKLSIGDN